MGPNSGASDWFVNTLKNVDIFKLPSHERENTKTMFLASLVISPVVAHGPQTIVGLTRTAFNAVHPSVKGRQIKTAQTKMAQRKTATYQLDQEFFFLN